MSEITVIGLGQMGSALAWTIQRAGARINCMEPIAR